MPSGWRRLIPATVVCRVIIDTSIMTFRVDIENFASAVQQLIGSKVAALSTREGITIATSADPSKGIIVGSSTAKSVQEVRELLAGKGLELMSGEWSDQCDVLEDTGDEGPPHIVAVAYKSRDTMPGVWVDAFPYEPSSAEVLKALFDEFESTGETSDTTFEEFVRLANPNVVVVPPSEVARFAKAHKSEE